MSRWVSIMSVSLQGQDHGQKPQTAATHAHAVTLSLPFYRDARVTCGVVSGEQPSSILGIYNSAPWKLGCSASSANPEPALDKPPDAGARTAIYG